MSQTMKKKFLLRLSKWVLSILLLIIVAAVALPFFYKDKVLALVKSEANKSINATLNFSDLDISLFRNFPSVSIGLDSFSIIGKNEFAGVPLITANNIRATVDLMSVIRGGNLYTIKSVSLDKPLINIQILENGKANYEITIPDTTVQQLAEPSPFKLSLKRYAIKNGTIFYKDRQSQMDAELKGVNHSGKGDFTESITDLAMLTKIDTLSYQSGATQLLKNAKLDWNVTLNADMANKRFTIKDNDLTINALQLLADGFVQIMPNEDVLTDVNFKAPQSDFKNLISLIPNAYTKDYTDVKASGNFSLSGNVKGSYNAKTKKMPAFKLNLNVDNGSIKYPQLPMGITNVFVKMDVNSPTSNYDQMVVNAPVFKMQIGNNPIDAKFILKTLLSNPDVDATLKGKLNLAELTKAFPMDGVKNMSGLLTADIILKAKQSYLNQRQYENVNMAGSLQMQGLNYQAEGTPPILINSAAINFTPQRVTIQQFVANLGKSDITANGTIDNILAYFSPEKTMQGNIYFRSNYFNANEWTQPEPASNQPKQASNNSATSAASFNRFDFTVDGAVNSLKYDKYNLKNVVAQGHFTPNSFTLNKSGFALGDSDFSFNGNIKNVFGYLYGNDILTGNLQLASNKLDMNQFMTTSPTTASATAPPTATEPIRVPKNIDMIIQTSINRLLYTNMDMSNVIGQIVVKDEQARLVNVKTNMLGGVIGLTGGYNSKPQKPTFDLKYDLHNIEFKQAFNTFNTVKKIAPIAQYLNGKFNTTMDMKGALNNDLSPDFSTLTADGFLQTFSAILQNFKPLEAIGNKLKIDAFKNVTIKDTKNWFEVKNGFVEVKEFDYQLKDIALKIGGKHGFTQDMDYSIKAKIPRKLLDQNGLGAANAAANQLLSEANKLGLNINAGEFINVLFKITGTSTSPTVAMKLVGTEGKSVADSATETAKEAAQKALDSAKVVANKKLDEAKQKAKEMADKAADSLQRIAKQKADEAMKKAKDEINKKAGDIVNDPAVKDKVKQVEDKVGKKVDDVLGDKAKKEVEKAKEKLDDWNPFKKKKDN